MDKKSIDKNFYIIIEKYCISLGLFAQTIIKPTDDVKNIIKRKKRNRSFDEYITSINNFNDLIHKLTVLLKEIIVSLNKVFIKKDMKSLSEFIENIQSFLVFLLKENVFLKLYEIREEFDDRYTKNKKLIEKVNDVRNIIITLFDISIDITTIFIPQFTTVKRIIPIIESINRQYIENRIIESRKQYVDVDEIIRQLLDIELRSQIISSIDIDEIYQCLSNNNADDIIIVIETLQSNYVALLQTIISLRHEIEVYRTKKQSLLTKIRDVLHL